MSSQQHALVLPRLVMLTALILAVVACTGEGEAADPTDSTRVESTPLEVTTSTALPPPEVDVGVDLESAVIRLAVVGDVSDDLWAGHFAYWNSINTDLGGIGGRYEVELVRVDSIRDAVAVGALAVSLDVGDDASVVLELLVANHGLVSVEGRLENLLLAQAAPQMVVSNLDRLDHPDIEIPDQIVVVTDPARECVAPEGAAEEPLGAVAVRAEPVSYVMCVPGASMLSAAAEVLGSSPGSALIVPGSDWRPELGVQLAGSQVYVVGYPSGPGVEAAPGGEVMALILGNGPWTADLIEGYGRALSMQVALESALDGGELTRSSVRSVSDTFAGVRIGFGSDLVPVGVGDPDEPTGIRFLFWMDP